MFTKGFDSYACPGDSIKCTVDGLEVIATIHHDIDAGYPDTNDEGFWPSRDEKAAGWVLPENFDREQAKAKKVWDAFVRDEWFYCGIVLTVRVEDTVLVDRVSLWGIECNYPDTANEYLLEVANELLPEALTEARAKLAKLYKAHEYQVLRSWGPAI
jgi:hypothetical protein